MTDRSPAPKPSSRAVHVLEVGGSHLTAARISVDGAASAVRERVDSPLDPHQPASALLDALAQPALALGPSSDADRVIAMPGPMDYERGLGSFAGIGKFTALDGVDLRQELASRLGCAPERLHFVNDAVAYAVGEWAHGAGERARRMICLTLGTGVGSAFLHEGSPVSSGTEVPPQGFAYRLEIGGSPLEDTVSSRAIRADHRRRTGREESVKAIADRARAGDPHAVDTLDAALTELGRAMAPWVASFAADVLVIGGAMSRSWSLLEAPLRRGLADGAEGATPPAVSRLRVRRAALDDTAPLLGAADWLLRTVDPSDHQGVPT